MNTVRFEKSTGISLQNLRRYRKKEVIHTFAKHTKIFKCELGLMTKLNAGSEKTVSVHAKVLQMLGVIT